jgi:hypothetical protein
VKAEIRWLVQRKEAGFGGEIKAGNVFRLFVIEPKTDRGLLILSPQISPFRGISRIAVPSCGPEIPA